MTSNGNPTLAYLLSDTREIMHQVQSFCFTKFGCARCVCKQACSHSLARILLLLSVQKERKKYKLMKEYPIISTENFIARQYHP